MPFALLWDVRCLKVVLTILPFLFFSAESFATAIPLTHLQQLAEKCEAGSEYPRLTPVEDLAVVRYEGPWSANRVLELIRERHRWNLPLTRGALVAEGNESLYSAAQRFFANSWVKAKQEALGDGDLDGRGVQWTREDLIKEIVKRKKEGASLSSLEIIREGGRRLIDASIRHFGSWRKAKIEALTRSQLRHDTSLIKKRKMIDIAYRLLDRFEAGLPISYKAIVESEGDTFARVARRAFGEWSLLEDKVRLLASGRDFYGRHRSFYTKDIVKEIARGFIDNTISLRPGLIRITQSTIGDEIINDVSESGWTLRAYESRVRRLYPTWDDFIRDVGFDPAIVGRQPVLNRPTLLRMIKFLQRKSIYPSEENLRDLSLADQQTLEAKYGWRNLGNHFFEVVNREFGSMENAVKFADTLTRELQKRKLRETKLDRWLKPKPDPHYRRYRFGGSRFTRDLPFQSELMPIESFGFDMSSRRVIGRAREISPYDAAVKNEEGESASESVTSRAFNLPEKDGETSKASIHAIVDILLRAEELDPAEIARLLSERGGVPVSAERVEHELNSWRELIAEFSE